MKKDINNFFDEITNKSNGELVRLLNKLGKLPEDFDEKPLLFLLKHKNEKVRYLATKNLAKLGKIALLDNYIYIIKNDKSSIVRREAVSAIGRLRNPKTKNILFKYLNDSNPSIILQAIRGLLVFKKDDDVQKRLIKLRDHPNEIIQDIIKIEFWKKRTQSKEICHSKSLDFLKNTIVHGDVRDILKLVPNDSIHLTFTSPPYYNAKDYSIYQSYKEYLDFLKEVFIKVHKITKEGRFFLLNTSPIIIPRVGRKYSSKRYPIPYDIHPLLIKMGWEFIDDIVWIKPEASAKNRNAGFLQHRKPLAYKPNACSECVMVYRKKTDRLIDWNIRRYDKKTIEESKINGDFETSNVWKIDPTFDKTHSAVFPIELCNKVIKFYSMKGDLVFDPFAGSGTFGKSALNLNRFFFLAEKEKKYVDRIKENISQINLLYDNNFIPRFLSIEKFREVLK